MPSMSWWKIVGEVLAILVLIAGAVLLWRRLRLSEIDGAHALTVRPEHPMILSVLAGFGCQIIVDQVLMGIFGALGMPKRVPIMVAVATVPMFAAVNGAASMAVYKLSGGERLRLQIFVTTVLNAGIYGGLFLGTLKAAFNARLMPEDIYKSLWGMGLMPPSAKFGIAFVFLLTQLFLSWFSGLLAAHIPVPPRTAVPSVYEQLSIPRSMPFSIAAAGLPLAGIGFVQFSIANTVPESPSYLGYLGVILMALVTAASSTVAAPLSVLLARTTQNWHWRAFLSGGSGMAYLWLWNLLGRNPEKDSSKFVLARILITLFQACRWVPAFGFVGLLATALCLKRLSTDRKQDYEMSTDINLESDGSTDTRLLHNVGDV